MSFARGGFVEVRVVRVNRRRRRRRICLFAKVVYFSGETAL